MNMWQILEIEATKDTSIIKKAYAKKLKIYHPEDDPMGYQKLREAFDAALKYSKGTLRKNFRMESDILESPVTNPLIKDIHTPPPIDLLGDFIPESLCMEELNADFINKVETLYNNLFARVNIENWKRLLDSSVMWEVNNTKDLNIKMLRFLSDHQQLPQDVWKLIALNFNFSEMDNLFYSPFSELIKYIIIQLNRTRCLNFSNLKGITDVDYEIYFMYRDKVLASLIDGNLEDTSLYLGMAKAIYNEDLDLLHMELEYYSRTKSSTNLLPILNHLLIIKKDDIAGLFSRGKIYYDHSQYALAIEDYCDIKNLDPENLELPFLMGECYYRLEAFKDAKKYFEKALLLAPSNNYIKYYLTRVNKELKDKFTLELKKDWRNKPLRLKLASIKKEIKYEQRTTKTKIARPPISVWKLLRNAFWIFMISYVVIFVIFFRGESAKPDSTNYISNIGDVVDNTKTTIDLTKINIDKIPDGTNYVKGTFTSFTNLNIFLRNGDKLSVVFIGTINGKDFIFTTSVLLAAECANTKQLDFKGTIENGPSASDQILILKKLKELNISTNNLISMRYIIIHDELDTK